MKYTVPSKQSHINFSSGFKQKGPQHSKDVSSTSTREIGKFEQNHCKGQKIKAISQGAKTARYFFTEFAKKYPQSWGYQKRIKNRLQPYVTVESEKNKLETDEDKLGSHHDDPGCMVEKNWYKGPWKKFKKQVKKFATSKADVDNSSDESVSDKNQKIYQRYQKRNLNTPVRERPSDSTRNKHEESLIFASSEAVKVKIGNRERVSYGKNAHTSYVLSHGSIQSQNRNKEEKEDTQRHEENIEEEEEVGNKLEGNGEILPRSKILDLINSKDKIQNEFENDQSEDKAFLKKAVQIADTINASQITETNNAGHIADPKIANTNNTGQIANTNNAGQNAKINNAGQNAEINNAGQNAETNDTGQVAETNDTGQVKNDRGQFSHTHNAGQNAEINNAGQNAEINNVGQVADTNNAGQIAHTHNAGQNADTNNAGQNAEIINADQNADTNNAGQIADINNAGQIADTNNAGQNAEINNAGQNADTNNAGQNVEINNAGQNADTNNAGQNAEINNAGQNAEIKNAGQNAEINNSGQIADTNNAGHIAEINNTGQNAEINNAGQNVEINNSGQIADTNNAGQIVHTRNARRIANTNNAGQSSEINNSGQIAEINNAGHIAETNNAGQIANTNNSGRIANTSNASQIAEINNSGQIAEINNAGHIAETNNSGQISDTNNASQIAITNNAGHIIDTNNAGQIAITNNAGHIIDTNSAGQIAITNNAGHIIETNNAGQNKELMLHKEEHQVESQIVQREDDTQLEILKDTKNENNHNIKDRRGSKHESTLVRLYRNVVRNETCRMMTSIDMIVSEAKHLFGVERTRIFFDILNDELFHFGSTGAISNFVPNMTESRVRQHVLSFFEHVCDTMNRMMTLLLGCPDSKRIQQMPEPYFMSLLQSVIDSIPQKAKAKEGKWISSKETKESRFIMTESEFFERALREIPEECLYRVACGDKMVLCSSVDTKIKENGLSLCTHFPSDCRLFISIPTENGSYWNKLDRQRASRISRHVSYSFVSISYNPMVSKCNILYCREDSMIWLKCNLHELSIDNFKPPFDCHDCYKVPVPLEEKEKVRRNNKFFSKL